MINYRPHIDGLRAIAVLSVLVFHLNEEWLPGGFTGVDIFFVISGYLISKLILKELQETADFSFSRFYVRRIRRLLPAMLMTCFACLLASFYFLSPNHLEEFAQSAIYAILSVSNIYFWATTSYFDSASHFKPLLHTWSLSIEEQFYLVWPLIIYLTYRWRKSTGLLAAIILVGVFSFALNLYLFANREWFVAQFAVESLRGTVDLDASAFYLLPFRVFEFSIGACLIFKDWDKLPKVIHTCLFIIGSALLIYSFFWITKSMNFPSHNALWPCIGAALLIISGSQHHLAKILTNPLSMGIGLISYSLYLVHWPIIVFYKVNSFQGIEWSDGIILTIASVLVATALYKLVEQPFRKPSVNFKQNLEAQSNNRAFLIGALASTVLLCATSFYAIYTKGWSFRYPPEVLAQFDRYSDEKIDLESSVGQYYKGPFANNGKPKVLVIGDSLAADLINAFYEGESIHQLDMTGILINHNCLAIFPIADWVYQDILPGRQGICKKEHQKVLALESRIAEADTVILAANWWDARLINHINSTASYIRNLGVANVFVLGQKVQTFEGLHLLASRPLSLLKTMRIPLNPTSNYHNQILSNFAKSYDYFDLLEHFCNKDGCRQATDEGFVIVFDTTHMTPEGAKFIGKSFANTEWFKKILATKTVN